MFWSWLGVPLCVSSIGVLCLRMGCGSLRYNFFKVQGLLDGGISGGSGEQNVFATSRSLVGSLSFLG